jgi:hypothetical protein
LSPTISKTPTTVSPTSLSPTDLPSEKPTT